MDVLPPTVPCMANQHTISVFSQVSTRDQSGTPQRARRRVLLAVVAATLIAVGGFTGSAHAAPKDTNLSNAPATKGKDTFTEMVGRVVSSSSSKIRIDFFPTGQTQGWGSVAYDAEIELKLDSAAVLNDRAGQPLKKLSAYRPGAIVTVTGHVDPYDYTWQTCSYVGKVLVCTTHHEQRYRHWIDSITTNGGKCTQSRSINVEIPWARNHNIRFLLCVDGTRTFAYLNRWDGIKTAHVSLKLPSETIELDMTDGAVEEFTPTTALTRGTRITGTLVYDVADDGLDAYSADLKTMRLS